MKTRKIRPPFFASLLLMASLFVACDKLDLPKGTPACIKEKIKAVDGKDIVATPTSVTRWEVDGKTYYYLASACCDQFNDLVDENCNYICAPDGGLTGQGDGNCPVWVGEIKTELIWEHD